MYAIALQSAVVYISTSIDDLVLLILFHSQAKKKGERIAILLGHLSGIGVLVAISLVGSYLTGRLLKPEYIGLLGLLPIVLGIQELRGKKEKNEASITFQEQKLVRTALLVTIASGSDNLAIYIPWFTTLTQVAWIVMVLTFLLMALLFWSAGYLLANQRHIQQLLARFASLLIPVVFITLGLSILSGQGTLGVLKTLLKGYVA